MRRSLKTTLRPPQSFVAMPTSSARWFTSCRAPRSPCPRPTFDLIFADPPYAEGSGSAVVASVARADWLGPGGWISVETGRNDAIEPGELIVEAIRDVGRARLTLLRRP